jgi:hypothetical protein
MLRREQPTTQLEKCARCERRSEGEVWGVAVCNGCYAKWHATAPKFQPDRDEGTTIESRVAETERFYVEWTRGFVSGAKMSHEAAAPEAHP